MPSHSRIDVHQHLIPPFWASSLADHGGDPSGWGSPDWTPDSAITFMDGLEISTGILSLTAPGVAGWKGAARSDMTRRVNDYGADLVARRPDRFGSFATLPLPKMDDALIELRRAYEDLHVDGVVLHSNYEGNYLGDAFFAPLWDELNRRHAVVFIHPGKPEIPLIEGIPGPLVDYPFDTTRVAVQLVLNGVIARSPSVRIILSHGGGYLPFASHRFAELAASVRPEKPKVEDTLAGFRKFYFDTALVGGPAAMPGLKAFAEPRHILFGSDSPYASGPVEASFTAQLDSYGELTGEERAAINNGNAKELFKRLSDQSKAVRGSYAGDRVIAG